MDALDDVERAAVRRHLDSCASCAQEVAEFREVGVRLADSVAVNPPAELRERVLREARATRQLPPTGRSLPSPSALGPRVRKGVSLAAAAALVVLSTVLAGTAWRSHQDAEQARRLTERIAAVTTDPSRTQVAGRVSRGGTASVVAARGDAVFAARDLPAPPQDRTYQLWVIDGGTARSAGLMTTVRGATQAWVPGVAAGSTLAVTVEPEGGSKQPTTVPLVTLQVG